MFGRRSDRVKEEQVRGLGKAVLALVLSASLVMSSVAPATMALAETAGEAATSQTAEAQDDGATTDGTEETSTGKSTTEETTADEPTATTDDAGSSDAGESADETDADPADKASVSTNLVLAASPMAAPVLRAPAATTMPDPTKSVTIDRWNAAVSWNADKALWNTLSKIKSGDVIYVNLSSDITTQESFTILSGATVVLYSTNGSSLYRGNMGNSSTAHMKNKPMFTVEEGGTLILGRGVSSDTGLTITGGSNTYAEGSDITSNMGLVATNNGGNILIQDGVTITNFTTTAGSAVTNVAPILTTAGETTMTGGTITGNTVGAANGSSGDGVVGGLAWTGGTGTISGGTISNNTTKNNGGGLYASGGATVTMSDGTISDNKAGTLGGGAYVSSATLNLTGGTITSNSATSEGGGICVDGGTLTMTGGEVSSNSGVTGGGIRVRTGTGTITGGTVSSNTATGNGGGVVLGTASSSLGGTVQATGNKANGNGGGVYLDNGADITGGTISGNEAGANDGTGNGGGVVASSGECNISGATIKNNTASSAAGGIYIGSSATVTLTNTTVTNDLGSDGKAPTYTGGSKLKTQNGYAITNDGGKLTIADGTEVSNFNVPARFDMVDGTADDEYSAAVYTKGAGTTDMTGGTIKGNRIGYRIPETVTTVDGTAISSDDLTSLGLPTKTGLDEVVGKLNFTSGGLGYGGNSTGTISGGVIGDSSATLSSRKNYTDVSQSGHIEGNDDANYGDIGGLMAAGQAKVTLKSGALIAGNEGAAGAGGVGVTGDAVITMEGGTIEHNTTFFNGGGVSAFEMGGKGGTFVMNAGTINQNVTYGKGGGILVHSDNVKLAAGTISNNIARVMGGGIYVCGDSNTSYNVLSIVKGNVSGNKATFAGSDLTKDANYSRYYNRQVFTLGSINVSSVDASYAYTDYVKAALAERLGNRGDSTQDLTDVETFGLSTDTLTYSRAKGLTSTNDNGVGYDLIDSDPSFHTGSGGGLWLCPYGSVWDSAGDGTSGNYVSITGNTAEWQGDDVSKDASASGTSGGMVLKLDGSFNYDYNPKYPGAKTGAYDSNGESSSLANEHLALKNTDTSTVSGGVQITGNVSRRGGGIGSNGVVALGPAGDSTSIIFKPSIDVTKSWSQGLVDQLKGLSLTDDDTITITAWADVADFKDEKDANGKALTRWRTETDANGNTTDVTRVKVGEVTMKASDAVANGTQTAKLDLDSYVTDETGVKHYLFDFDKDTGVVPSDSKLKISLEETASDSLKQKANAANGFKFTENSINGPLDNKPEVVRENSIEANGQTYTFSVRYNTVAFTGAVSNEGIAPETTTLPQTGQGGVAAWWLVGCLAVLAGLAASLRRNRRAQAALAAGLVGLGLAAGLALAPAPAQAATTGTVTLSPQSASTASLEGRQLMVGTVTADGDDARLQDATWASPQAQEAVTSVIAAQEAGWTGTALDAATWLGSHMSAQVAVSLAQACQGLPVQGRVSLGASSSLEDGLWLFTTAEDEDARMATAPIVTLVGARDLRLVAKADVPSLEKEVATVAPAGTVGAYSHANVAGLADGLSYRVTVTLPATYDAFTTYALAIEDHMEPGITLDRDSFVLADAAGRALPSSAYTVSFGADTTDGGITFTLRVADLKGSVALLSDSSTVTLTYRARLNGGASAGAANPNTNEARLTYPKGPASSSTGTTEPSQTRTFAFNLALTKVDGTTGERLSGATFSLRNQETGLWWDGSAWGSEEATFAIDGTREVPLVSPGTLELTEVAAPEGYAKLAEPVTLTLEADATEPVTFNLATSTTSNVATVVESDAQVGHATVRVANSKTPTPPTPGELIRRLLPKTDDPTSVPWALVVAAAGIALVVYGRKRGEQGEE